MDRGRPFAAIAFAGVAAVALGVFVANGDDPPAVPDPADGPAEGSAGGVAAPASPFSTEIESGEGVATGAAPNVSADNATADPGARSASGARDRVAPFEGPVDVTTLGRASLDDDTFEALAARLAEDPELLAALVDEFRSETDPDRLSRLAILLGEVGGPDVTALAAELVYDVDEARRGIGLDLLRRVQPGNDEARAVVSGLLSNGTDRETLVPVLQTLTRPGVVPVDERTLLAEQIAVLSGHQDPGVRRLGLDVLSRWSEGEEHVALMRGALGDPHPGVREAAAHALVGRPDADGTIASELFAVADDPQEEERVRRTALLALKNLPLDEADLERRLAIERGLDRLPAR